MGDIPDHSLSKDERLCSLRLINSLYESSDSIKAFPVLFTYKSPENFSAPFQVMFTVPKRNFKRAVQRNRIKRLMREAFRLAKPEFTDSLNGKKIICSLIYTSKELPDLKTLHLSIRKIIHKLHEKSLS